MSKKDFKPSIYNTNEENNVLKALQGDYELCKSYNKKWHNLIDEWTDEYMGRPYGNEKDGKSKIVTRDIKKHSEWLQASILDPFVSTPDIIKCSPTNIQSIKLARNAEMILNQQFCRQFNRYNFLSRALKVMDIEGTCIVKTGWEFLEEEREVYEKQVIPIIDEAGNPVINEMDGQPVLQEIKVKVKKKIRVIDKPTAEVVRNKDIFLDPRCLGNIENMQFIIHEYETDLSTLKSDKRFKNVDKIKVDTDDEHEYKDNDYGELDGETFEFNDKPRKKIVVREYWGNYDLNNDGIAEPIVCAWVGSICIRLEENPYPDKKPPFIITPVLPIPFQLIGESNAELLGDTQKLKTAIMRGFIDNLAASNNAQIGVRQGALDAINQKRMLEGKNFMFMSGTAGEAFWTGSFNQLPNSIFNLLQLLDAEATSLTGVNTYGTNQTTNMLGENTASSRGVLDGGNLRKLMIVKNISENLIKPLMRKWLEYDAVLLPEETIIRATANNSGEFEVIRRDDLYGSIDLELTISTNEDNAAKARELAFLLQTIGPNEDSQVRKMIMIEIANLHKMHELANRLETYEPQPDPLQQELMIAQIEYIKAQTQELLASAGRQQIDGSLKEAKIGVEQAKAQSIGKDINLKGLDFYQKQNRFDTLAANALKEKEIDERSQIEKQRLQLEQLDKILKIEGEKAKRGEKSIYDKFLPMTDDTSQEIEGRGQSYSPISNDNRSKAKTNYSPSANPNTSRKLYNS